MTQTRSAQHWNKPERQMAALPTQDAQAQSINIDWIAPLEEKPAQGTAATQSREWGRSMLRPYKRSYLQKIA